MTPLERLIATLERELTACTRDIAQQTPRHHASLVAYRLGIKAALGLATLEQENVERAERHRLVDAENERRRVA